MAIPAIGAILSGVGRAAVGAGARGVAGAGIRGGIRSGIAQGVKNIGREIARNIFSGRSLASSTKTDENGNETIVPVDVRVVEGYATATKGSGGGGGGLVPFGGGSSLVSRKSSAIVKAGGGNSLIEQLRSLRARLDQLVEIELAAKKSLEDQILRYIRDSEKNARSEEQKQQETGSKAKSSVEKNPVVKAAKKAFGGIFDFIKNLVIEFIKYKVLDWLSKPENFEKIKNTIQFFMNFFKVLKTLYDVILGPQLKLMGMMTSLVAGGINTFFEFIGGVVNFFSLKWLPGFDGIIETIKNIPKIFTEMIPNAINGIINFFTKTLFGAAENEGEKAVSSAVGETQQKTNPVVSATAEAGQSAVESVDKIDVSGIGNAIGGVVQSITNPVASITKFVDGMFGGGKKEETPQLKEGGLVGKFKNSVSVKPLDELANVAGISGTMKKSIKMFMDLLTMPFKLMGAAMIALVMNTVGKIPGVKMFLKPIVQNIISAFNLPPSIAKIVDNSGTLKKEKKKEPPKVEPKPTSGPPPGSAASSIDQSSASAVAAGNQGAGSIDQSRAGATAAMQAGQSAQTGQNFSSRADDRKGGEVKFKGPDGKPYKVIINATNGDYEVFQDSLFGQQIDISNDKNKSIKQKALNQVRAYFVNNAPDKGVALKLITADDVKRKKEINDLASAEKIDPKSKGGWISGPMSGYPVSLDGGLSTSFIGHGTEWVGFKKAAGGSLNSAFVIPYDTPATRSNGGLTQRRFKEAKTGGYHLPYAKGGTVTTDPNWKGDTGPGSRWYYVSTAKSKDRMRKKLKRSFADGGKIAEAAKSMVGTYFGPNGCAKSTRAMLAKAGVAPRPAVTGKVLDKGTPGAEPTGALKANSFGPDQGAVIKSASKVEAGDVVMWDTGGGVIGHVGVAIGGGQVVHNSSSAGHKLAKMGVTGMKFHSAIRLGQTGSVDAGEAATPTTGPTASGAAPTTDSTEAATPQFGADTVGKIQELYKLLNPGSEPSSAQLPKLQTENLVNTAFSTPSLIGKSTTAIIDASSQSSINTSVMSGDNPLGNTLPMTGNWSIFKINL